MNCPICGSEPETRKTESGFVVGCWTEYHIETHDFGEPDRPCLIENELIPFTGLTKETIEDATASWITWATEYEHLAEAGLI